MCFWSLKLHNLNNVLKQKNIYLGINKGKVSISWILNVLYNITDFFCEYVLLHLEWCKRKVCLLNSMYNVSLRVLNTLFKEYWHVYYCWNLHFYLLENLSLKNRFNYKLFENSWKHMWIKLLKLALSSNNRPYPKHGGHVSNLKKHNP